MMTKLGWSVLGIFVLTMIWLGSMDSKAQGKPFTAYETAGACVYVAGYGASPAIFVISKFGVVGKC